MEKKGRKRRGYCQANQKVKQKWVEPGVSGLLFTCNGNEKQAVREAYNVIEQALERWKAATTVVADGNDGDSGNSGADPEEEDVADSIKRFCERGLFISLDYYISKVTCNRWSGSKFIFFPPQFPCFSLFYIQWVVFFFFLKIGICF